MLFRSTGCLIELIRRMCEQEKGPDGIRRTRFAIIRQTLSQIKQTVLKEFYTWAGPITTFKVSENTIYIKFNDVESEIHLIPLDDEQDIRRLLSLQLTGAWINEAPEVDVSIVPALCGRLGRYPSKAQGGPTWFGLIMDGNFGTLTDGSDVKKFRIVDGLQFKLSDALGGQAIAMFQQNKADAGDSTITTLGGREIGRAHV